MVTVLRTTWPLLLGILLVMIGAGMQGTLMGVRGAIEGMTTQQLAVVTSAYYGGFLAGSRIVPILLQRVGHVRVFAALGSMISAVLVLYAAAPHWLVWTVLRLAIGFGFVGVYVTAESWLNASASNETRGQALSAYMIVQMLGIITGQVLMNVGDPGGWILFVIPSVLVSLSFTPILLSSGPTPAFATLKPMGLRRLFAVSPLGCVGIFLMGGVLSALFGMAPVWGTEMGFDVASISAFVAMIYVGGLVLQFPVGWASDRHDRRQLLLGLVVIGAVAVAVVLALPLPIWGLLVVATIVGGVANPGYSLLLAHANDYLDSADMAAASAGLLFLNGLGSIAGPLVTGWLMARLGPDGYWIWIGMLLVVLAVYTAYRMTRRPAVASTGFAVLAPEAMPLAIEAVLGEAQSGEDEDDEDDEDGDGAGDDLPDMGHSSGRPFALPPGIGD